MIEEEITLEAIKEDEEKKTNKNHINKEVIIIMSQIADFTQIGIVKIMTEAIMKMIVEIETTETKIIILIDAVDMKKGLHKVAEI